jgi:ATP-dependent DNA ligase
VVQDGQSKLISKNPRVFRGFNVLRADLASRLPDNTILDGEICCRDDHERPQFYALMSRKAKCYFYAFDALRIAGEDIRDLPLLERKARLKKLIGRKCSRLLYYVVRDLPGIAKFKIVQESIKHANVLLVRSADFDHRGHCLSDV